MPLAGVQHRLTQRVKESARGDCYTVLIDGGVQQALPACCPVEGGEELGLLVVVVLRDAVVPGEAVADEVVLVAGPDAGSLLVDAVQAADEGVVAQGHVGGFEREWIGLFVLLISRDRLSLVGGVLPCLW